MGVLQARRTGKEPERHVYRHWREYSQNRKTTGTNEPPASYYYTAAKYPGVSHNPPLGFRHCVAYY